MTPARRLSWCRQRLSSLELGTAEMRQAAAPQSAASATSLLHTVPASSTAERQRQPTAATSGSAANNARSEPRDSGEAAAADIVSDICKHVLGTGIMWHAVYKFVPACLCHVCHCPTHTNQHLKIRMCLQALQVLQAPRMRPCIRNAAHRVACRPKAHERVYYHSSVAEASFVSITTRLVFCWMRTHVLALRSLRNQRSARSRAEQQACGWTRAPNWIARGKLSIWCRNAACHQPRLRMCCVHQATCLDRLSQTRVVLRRFEQDVAVPAAIRGNESWHKRVEATDLYCSQACRALHRMLECKSWRYLENAFLNSVEVAARSAGLRAELRAMQMHCASARA